jgi:general secretion pathway protein A
MALWDQPVGELPPLPEIKDDWRFFRLTAQQQAFSLARIQGDLNRLRSLNLPAVLEITLPGAEKPIYMALVGMDGQEITLQAGDTRFRCAADTLRAVWSGVAYLPWKNFYGLSGIIPRDTNQDEILTLKMMLREIGFTQIPLTPYYDPDTRNAVRKVQERHGLSVDGFVGPMTKIVLYHDVPSLRVPQLLASAVPGADAETEPGAKRPLAGRQEGTR